MLAAGSLGEPPERLPRRAVQGFGGAQPPSNRFSGAFISRRSIGSLKRSLSALDASEQGVTKLELARRSAPHGELELR